MVPSGHLSDGGGGRVLLADDWNLGVGRGLMGQRTEQFGCCSPQGRGCKWHFRGVRAPVMARELGGWGGRAKCGLGREWGG